MGNVSLKTGKLLVPTRLCQVWVLYPMSYSLPGCVNCGLIFVILKRQVDYQALSSMGPVSL